MRTWFALRAASIVVLLGLVASAGLWAWSNADRIGLRSTVEDRVYGLLHRDTTAAGLTQAAEAGGYRRDLFGGWAGNSCRDMRDEILIRDAAPDTLQFDGDGCHPVAGQWTDYWTGATITDPQAIEIDHVVPLAEIWRSGGNLWPPDGLHAAGNDPSNLVVTAKAVNRDKSDRHPGQWRPAAHRCEFAAMWLAFKQAYQLTADSRELYDLTPETQACGLTAAQ